MAKEHPKFIQPKLPNENVYRYLSLDKLIHFLSTKQFYFSRVDKFDDPFEGAISQPTKELEDEWKNRILEEHENVSRDSLDSMSTTREIFTKVHLCKLLASLRNRSICYVENLRAG